MIFVSREAKKKEKEEDALKEKDEPVPESTKSMDNDSSSCKEQNEEEETKAAVVLQSNYRGYKERKKFKERKTSPAEGTEDKKTNTVEDLGKSANKQDVEEDESTYEAEENDDSDQTQVPEEEEHTEAGEEVLIQNAGKEGQNKQEKIPGAVDSEEETKAATVIQSNFRGHKERKRLEEEGKIPKKKQKESSPAGDKEEVLSEEMASTGAQGAADVSSDDVKPDDPDETKAAVVIQSNFRGHKERKRLKEERNVPKKNKKEPVQIEQPVPESLEDISSESPDGPDEEKAATVLQSNFRGHRDRKKLKAEKEAQQKSKEENVILNDLEQEMKDEDEVLDVSDVKIERKEETDVEKEKQEEEEAAVKLQSNFRGYKDRKNLKANKEAAKNEAEELKNFSEEVKTHQLYQDTVLCLFV